VTTRNTHPYKRKWSDVTMVEPENNCFPTREFILKELYTAQEYEFMELYLITKRHHRRKRRSPQPHPHHPKVTHHKKRK